MPPSSTRTESPAAPARRPRHRDHTTYQRGRENDAEEQDALRREQAVQGDRLGQDAPAAGRPEVRRCVRLGARPPAAARSTAEGRARSTSPRPTSRRAKKLLGRLSPSRPPDRTARSNHHGTRQAGSQRPQEAPDHPRARQRLPRPALAPLPQGQGAGHPLAGLQLPRPQGPQGRLPQALDPADQRRCPRQRA